MKTGGGHTGEGASKYSLLPTARTALVYDLVDLISAMPKKSPTPTVKQLKAERTALTAKILAAQKTAVRKKKENAEKEKAKKKAAAAKKKTDAGKKLKADCAAAHREVKQASAVLNKAIAKCTRLEKKANSEVYKNAVWCIHCSAWTMKLDAVHTRKCLPVT